MQKKTKITIGLAGIVLLASLILIVAMINKSDRDLKKQLKEMAIDYYENDYKKFNPNMLKQWKELRIDLDALKGYEKDISSFEEHECDTEETYATIVYKDESSYETKIHLSCAK